jgi:hypothetical protein
MRRISMHAHHAPALLLLLALIGCAAADGEPRRPADDNQYVTGSRIPQRDKAGVSTMTPEEWERAKEFAAQPVKPRMSP